MGKCKHAQINSKLSQISLYRPIATSTASTAVRYYLVAYNILSTLGWSYVFLLTLVHLSNIDGQSSITLSAGPKTASSTLARFISSIPYFKASGYNPAPTVEALVPPYLLPLFHHATTIYSRVGPQTAFIQTFAVLEVLHVLLKWVRSPLQTTAMQVSSRLYIIWGITEQFDVVSTFPASFPSSKLKRLRPINRRALTPSTRQWSLRGLRLK
jgi:very-long-chain (3R)-3-hydroxyacyl-CoA dehydratase